MLPVLRGITITEANRTGMSERIGNGHIRPIERSLREYARGIAGGLLFSLPLLYTMEMWWAGFIANPERLMGYIAVTFLLLLGYNRFAGMRSDAGWAEVVIDSIEEMGIGLIVSLAVLWAIGRFNLDMGLAEVMGKVIVEGMTVAIGVSVGTAQLGSNGDEDDDDDVGMDARQGKVQPMGFKAQLVIAFCGAVLFAMNIAPTEEVMLVAVEITHWQMGVLALFSIALGVSILYYIDFTGSRQIVLGGRDGSLVVLRGAVIMYAVALGASALMLWFYGHFDGVALITKVSLVIVLGVVSTLGASAGRLLLQIRSLSDDAA